jgi:hypothetical protein
MTPPSALDGSQYGLDSRPHSDEGAGIDKEIAKLPLSRLRTPKAWL